MTFNDTITLGALIIAVLVVIVGGFPLRLIQALRTERDELQHQLDVRQREIGRLTGELARAQARTDLEPVLIEIKELVAAVHLSTEAAAERQAGIMSHLTVQTEILRKVGDVINGGGKP